MYLQIKKPLLVLVMVLSFLGLNAQKQVLNDVLQAKTKGTGVIIKDNTVTGYFSFYELEKKDKKTKNYQLNIYDQNLTPLSSKKFSSQEDLTALEATFNGELLLIKFFDNKEDKFVFKSYDQNSQQVSSKSLSAEKVYNPYGELSNDEEGESATVTPIEGQGFVHFIVKARGGRASHTYNEITFIPNNKDVKGWTWTTAEKSEDFEWGDVLGSNGKVLLCLVNKRPKFMSKDIEDFILGIDIATGKKLFEYSLEDRKYAISTLNAIAEPDGNFQIFGLYFEKDAKTAKASSLGLFGFTVDPAGKVITRKYESWEKDVSKFLKVKKKVKLKILATYIFINLLKLLIIKYSLLVNNIKPT
jgi:hypothetical protein